MVQNPVDKFGFPIQVGDFVVGSLGTNYASCCAIVCSLTRSTIGVRQLGTCGAGSFVVNEMSNGVIPADPDDCIVVNIPFSCPIHSEYHTDYNHNPISLGDTFVSGSKYIGCVSGLIGGNTLNVDALYLDTGEMYNFAMDFRQITIVSGIPGIGWTIGGGLHGN